MMSVNENKSMAKSENKDVMKTDGAVKVHIGPEVVCEDVEKVNNDIKINCCKCSSSKVMFFTCDIQV